MSVCITTYNHALFVAEALDSVLAQDVDFDYEILVGEDDSGDGTRDIVKRYAERFPNKIRAFFNSRDDVIYVDGIPTGRWNLMNNLKHARGEYIALLEGDDYWVDPRKLAKQARVLDEDKQLSGCFHETEVMHGGRWTGRLYGRHEKGVFRVADTLSTQALLHTSSLVFRKSFLPDPLPTWFTSILSADMALFMMLANEGPLFRIPEVMSVYRKHPGGITNTNVVRAQFHDQRIRLMECFREYLDPRYDAKIDEVVSFHMSALTRLGAKQAQGVASMRWKRLKDRGRALLRSIMRWKG